MKIQFCGAARNVTGSAHLITLDDGKKILLDCGLYQGHSSKMEELNREWFFKPSEIDYVVLSHAHIDHSGRLPQLVKDGYRGHIYSTHATRSLCAIMLLDSARIQERDAEYFNKKQLKKKKRKRKPLKEPLYTPDDVAMTMPLFVGYSYEKWFRLSKNIKVLFRDAGHILGSASVTLEIKENGKKTRIGFSGDIGRPHRPILRDPVPMPKLDYLLCESTYGDREHEQLPAASEKLLSIIKETCIEKRGKLIIPAFSIGRTQEIVYLLDKLSHYHKLPNIPVYVDSPLAVNATVIFGSHPDCFDSELHEYMLIDKNPFGFNNLKYIRNVQDSKLLNKLHKPAIIISASGMMTGGRIRHHVFNNIEDPSTTLLFIGYCAERTPCSIIKSGVDKIKMFGEWKQVNAEIITMDSFSAHGDKNEMYDFIKNQKNNLKHLFLVHGEIESQTKFKKMLNHKGFKSISIPKLGSQYKINTK